MYKCLFCDGVFKRQLLPFQRVVETGGELALQEISRQKANIKNRITPEIENAVTAVAIENPAFGQVGVSNDLKKRGIFVSPIEVRCVWLRHDLESFKKRLKVLEAKGCSGFNEAQVIALEKAKEEKQAVGEIETEHPGYLGSQDTFYIGKLKGAGKIYQQTFIDTYSRVAFVKHNGRKNALVTADLVNDKVLPFFESEDIRLLRILEDI